MKEKLLAPNGSIWVCSACGKTAKNRNGDGNNGWDVSCMMNAVLVKNDKTLIKDRYGKVTNAEIYKGK